MNSTTSLIRYALVAVVISGIAAQQSVCYIGRNRVVLSGGQASVQPLVGSATAAYVVALPLDSVVQTHPIHRGGAAMGRVVVVGRRSGEVALTQLWLDQQDRVQCEGSVSLPGIKVLSINQAGSRAMVIVSGRDRIHWWPIDPDRDALPSQASALTEVQIPGFSANGPFPLTWGHAQAIREDTGTFTLTNGERAVRMWHDLNAGNLRIDPVVLPAPRPVRVARSFLVLDSTLVSGESVVVRSSETGAAVLQEEGGRSHPIGVIRMASTATELAIPAIEPGTRYRLQVGSAVSDWHIAYGSIGSAVSLNCGESLLTCKADACGVGSPNWSVRSQAVGMPEGDVRTMIVVAVADSVRELRLERIGSRQNIEMLVSPFTADCGTYPSRYSVGVLAMPIPDDPNLQGKIVAFQSVAVVEGRAAAISKIYYLPIGAGTRPFDQERWRRWKTLFDSAVGNPSHVIETRRDFTRLIEALTR